MIDFATSYATATADGRLQLPESRARGLWNVARRIAEHGIQGEFWECGVYRGGSARLIADAIRHEPREARELVLFDTFAGFSGVGVNDAAVANGRPVVNGRMLVSEDAKQAAQDALVFAGLDVSSCSVGPIPQCFDGRERSEVAFVNLDVDLYQPTRDALAFIIPRMVKGGVIVIDDFGDPDWPGVERAVEEMRDGRTLMLRETQAWMIF